MVFICHSDPFSVIPSDAFCHSDLFSVIPGEAEESKAMK